MSDTARLEAIQEREWSSDARWGAIGLVGAVLALWGPFLLKLRTDWTTNAQYEFGFFVPLFMAFLLALRWKDRPAPQPPHSVALALVATVTLLPLLLPLRIVQEANPDWRPLNWVYATVLVLLTLVPAYHLGGRAWVKHFLPPLLLIFVALPWPLAWEQGVIQSLSRAVAGITTELLNAVGISATQTGNVINVPTGPVGVEDACSGVRSVAGTLMASVFFGEFYRFSGFRRVILVVGGVLVALALNFVRAFALGWIAAVRGIEAIADWHDQAGLIIFGAAFGALWWGAELLSGDQPVSSKTRLSSRPGKLSFFVIGLALLWTGAVEIATESWYRRGERGFAEAPSWTPAFPEGDRSFQMTKISDEARSILRYSEGIAARFAEPGSARWELFYLRWAPGRSSVQLAVLHRPEICLPATGFRYLSPGTPAEIIVRGVTVPFDCSIFEHSGRPFYVYRTLAEERSSADPVLRRNFDQSVQGRLQSAWFAKRNLGQKLLQIGIFGLTSEHDAREDLARRLPRLIAAKTSLAAG